MNREREGQVRGSDEIGKEMVGSVQLSCSQLHRTRYTILLPGPSVIVG